MCLKIGYTGIPPSYGKLNQDNDDKPSDLDGTTTNVLGVWLRLIRISPVRGVPSLDRTVQGLGTNAVSRHG